MHGLANLTALNNQGCLYALAHANQIVVNGTYSQQRWDGGMLLVDVAVREDDVVYTLVNAGLGILTELVECLTQAFLTLLDIKQDGQLLGVKALISDVTKYIQLGVGEHRLWQAHHLTVAGIRRQDVGSYSADVLCQTHYQLLTDGVDGRVGDLRKLLTEVVEQHLWTV